MKQTDEEDTENPKVVDNEKCFHDENGALCRKQVYVVAVVVVSVVI